MPCGQYEIQRVGESQRQAVLQEFTLWGTSEDHVLGGVFLHDGQAEEVAEGI